jgi:hypothetical protein
VAAGDDVLVRAGDYSNEGIITFRRGGTALNKITFKAEPRRGATVQGFDTRNADYLRIEGFEITNDLISNAGDGINIRSNNVEIVDNYMHHLQHRGVESASSDNIYVADNYLYCVGAGMNISGNNWLVENNEIERLVRTGGMDADYSRFFGYNHIIRNNYFHGTSRAEIGVSHTDGFQTYSTNNGLAHNIIIEGNIVTGYFVQGVIARDMTTNAVLTDITIRNNIFANDFSERGSWGVMGRNVKNAVIVNNVFANIRYFGVGLDADSDNAVVKNNIFYNIDGSVYYSEGANLDGDYNLLYPGGRRRHIGPHDLYDVNPQFVNADSFNFQLQANSPAIDAGADTSAYGVVVDVAGNARPQGAGYDIGAYEYGSGGPGPGTPLYGDVSENDSVSAYDASLAAQYTVGLISLTADQMIKADVTGNGSVSATDASWIARKAVDPTIQFPVE